METNSIGLDNWYEAGNEEEGTHVLLASQAPFIKKILEKVQFFEREDEFSLTYVKHEKSKSEVLDRGLGWRNRWVVRNINL